MAGIPVELIYLFSLLAIIVVVFVFIKRPIYEAMFIGFLVMSFVLGRSDKIFEFLIKPGTNTLFYQNLLVRILLPL